jgi:hypothetical protein
VRPGGYRCNRWRRDSSIARSVVDRGEAHPGDVDKAGDDGVPDRILAFTWIGALPVAVAATLLAASTIDRFHAEGAARVFAQSMTLIGIAGCVAGVVLAALGALELLRV